MDSAPVYSALVKKLKRTHTLGTVSGLLGWDEQVNLPPDSADQRAEQMALLAELSHAAATDVEIGRGLSKLEKESQGALSAEDWVVIRQARRDYDRATKIPSELAAEKARLCSEAYHAWAAAKAQSDFLAFAPYLEKHLVLAKREAELLGWGMRAYDYAIDLHDPGMDAAAITRLFTELKSRLLPMVKKILNSPVKPPVGLFKNFPVDAQREFLRD